MRAASLNHGYVCTIFIEVLSDIVPGVAGANDDYFLACDMAGYDAS